jgi:hypothetical protein
MLDKINYRNYNVDIRNLTKYESEVLTMTKKEQEYLKRIFFVFPKLDNGDKCYLLGIAEGMALNSQFQDKNEEPETNQLLQTT